MQVFLIKYKLSKKLGRNRMKNNHKNIMMIDDTLSTNDYCNKIKKNRKITKKNIKEKINS